MTVSRELLASSMTVLAMTLMAAGCTSSPEASDTWSRSYLLPVNEVFDAAVSVLEDEEYWVDADPGGGRIEASPSDDRGSGAMLTIKVSIVDGRSRVDVLTRTGAEPGGMARRGEAQVLEFLHALDTRIREPGR